MTGKSFLPELNCYRMVRERKISTRIERLYEKVDGTHVLWTARGLTGAEGADRWIDESLVHIGGQSLSEWYFVALGRRSKKKARARSATYVQSVRP